jgi:cardiolipin synthase A/B
MSKATSWKFTATSEEAWEYILNSCSKAEKSIDIEQFAMGTDGEFVEKFAALLKTKAQQGIHVRVLIDAIGSFLLFQAPLRNELQEAGIDVVFHRTVIPTSFKRFFPFFLRDHRKLIIVDEQEAHLGGVILQERARHWRDTSVMLRGTIVEDCVLVFEIAWRRAKRMSPIGRVLSDGGKGEFFLAGNSYRLRDKHLYRSILRSAAEAKKNINITTPYLWLTRDMRRALRYARKHGTEIRFLLPRRSDNLWSDIIGRFFYRWMLQTGMTIFHYDRTLLHAKSITVDGDWGTVGSYNLDWLSTWLNYELNAISTNMDFVAELEAMFLDDISKSEEVTMRTKGWYGFFS